MEKIRTIVTFNNRYGNIENETLVYFRMENQNIWVGDTVGILTFDGEWFIDCKNSGRVEIIGCGTEWYGAYGNTIKPVKDFEKLYLSREGII